MSLHGGAGREEQRVGTARQAAAAEGQRPQAVDLDRVAARVGQGTERGAGGRVEGVDGAVAEILSNPADGVWVFARCLSAPDDPTRVGSEEMIFAQDIVEIRESS